MTQVKGVYRTYFRWRESLSDTYGTANALENNVACDMPGQILYMNWLILIMPLSTSMLNCAISLGRELPGSCFTTTGLLSVKLCHQFEEEKGRTVVLHQPVCAVLSCAISLGREGPGSCFTPTGLPSIKLCHQYG